MEAELVCVDSYGKKAGLGVLTDGGFMFTVPLHTVRKLLNPECALLTSLGKISSIVPLRTVRTLLNFQLVVLSNTFLNSKILD